MSDASGEMSGMVGKGQDGAGSSFTAGNRSHQVQPPSVSNQNRSTGSTILSTSLAPVPPLPSPSSSTFSRRPVCWRHSYAKSRVSAKKPSLLVTRTRRERRLPRNTCRPSMPSFSWRLRKRKGFVAGSRRSRRQSFPTSVHAHSTLTFTSLLTNLTITTTLTRSLATHGRATQYLSPPPSQRPRSSLIPSRLATHTSLLMALGDRLRCWPPTAKRTSSTFLYHLFNTSRISQLD